MKTPKPQKSELAPPRLVWNLQMIETLMGQRFEKFASGFSRNNSKAQLIVLGDKLKVKFNSIHQLRRSYRCIFVLCQQIW